MPDIKVFLSSTFRDLKDHREAVRKAIGKLRGFKVVGMEDFGSQNGHSKAVCLRELEACEAYVGVFAWYYGTIPEGEECSLTEAEYQSATDQGMPRLLFIADKGLSIHPDLVEEDAKRAKRKAFHDAVMKDRVVDFFVTPDDLAAKVVAALQKEFFAETTPLKSTTAPPHQLPSDIPDFTGRAKELNTLLSALDRDGGSAAVVTAIRGMGGIGKTTLAVHAARQLVARYPDAQIVVNLQGYSDAEPLKPIDAMAKVVQSLDPGFKPMDDLGQMTALYRSMLDGKRVLILLDNAPSKADLRALVPPPPCGLIVTAREPVNIDGAKSIALNLLTRPESVELLRSAAGRSDVSEAEWNRIAALCDGLPLALRVAGAFLGEAINWTASTYIQKLSDERTRLRALTTISKEERDVGAILGFSAHHLASSDPKLAARWQMLSVFPNDFDECAASEIWNENENASLSHLSALLVKSLLLFDSQKRRYRIHDLFRPISREIFLDRNIKDPSPGSAQRLLTARNRHSLYFSKVIAEADRLFLEGQHGVFAGLNLYDQESQNIITSMSWAVKYSGRLDEATLLSAKIPLTGANVLTLRQDQRQRIAWLSSAVRASRTLSDSELESDALGKLGRAYADIGETHYAVSLYHQALSISRKIGNKRGEATHLGNLGRAHNALGEYQQASEMLQSSLEISREIGDRRGESSRLGNLGNSYISLGKPLAALRHYKKALRISRNIGDLQGESARLSNIGNALAAAGKHRCAIKYYEEALSISNTIMDYRGIGNRLSHLSKAYADLGEYNIAIEVGKKALEITEKIESPLAVTVRMWLNEWE